MGRDMPILPRRIRDRVIAGRASDVVYVEARSAQDTGADGEVPRSVRAAASWSWRLVIIAVATAVVGYLIMTLSQIVIPVLLAAVLTVLLNPLNFWFRRVLRFPPILASLTTVLLLITFVTGVLTIAGRSFYEQFFDLWDKAVTGFSELLAWASEGPLQLDTAQLDGLLDNIGETLSNYSGVLASGAFTITSSITAIAAGTLLVLFLLIFFLKDGRALWIWCVRLLPHQWRETVFESSIRGWLNLHGYAKSTIIVAAIDAVGIGLGAFFLSVPLALPIAILVFLGAFIPIVGAFVSGSLAVLVALVDNGPLTALFMLLVVLAVQQIEGNVLQPLIMGHSVSMHPVAVILGVAGGTYLGGITGAVFAVPVMSFINTVVLYAKGHDKYPHMATRFDRPGGPPGTLHAQIAKSYGYELVEDAAGETLTSDDDVTAEGTDPVGGGEGSERSASPSNDPSESDDPTR